MSEAETLWAQLSAANPSKSTVSKDDLQKMFKTMEPNARAKLMTDLIFLGLGDMKQANPEAGPDDLVLLEFVPLKDISKETLEQALASPIQQGNAPSVTTAKKNMQLAPDQEPLFAMVAKDQATTMRMIVLDETTLMDKNKDGITTHEEALTTIRAAQAFAQEMEGKVLNGKDKPKPAPRTLTV